LHPLFSAHLLLSLPPRTSSFHFKVVKLLHVVENSTRSACGRPGGARNGWVSARSIFRLRALVFVDYIISDHCILCWNCIGDVSVHVLHHWCHGWSVSGHFDSWNVCFIFVCFVLFVASLQLCVSFVRASIFVEFNLCGLLEQLRSGRTVVGVFVVLLYVWWPQALGRAIFDTFLTPKGQLWVPLVVGSGRRGSGRSSGVPGTATSYSGLESEESVWFAETASDLLEERVLQRIMTVLWTKAFLWCPTLSIIVYKYRVSLCDYWEVSYVCVLSVLCVDIEHNVKNVILSVSNERYENVISEGCEVFWPTWVVLLRVKHLWGVGPRIGEAMTHKPVWSKDYF
jgi:hypothetical protein